MKVLFISNIPTPYRNDFYNELGKHVDLTVIYEAVYDRKLRFNWQRQDVTDYQAIFLSDSYLNEKKLNFKIFKYFKKKYDHIFVTNYSLITELAAILYLKLRHIPYYMEIDGGVIKKEKRSKRALKRALISGARMYFSPDKRSDEFLAYYGAEFKRIYRYPFTSLYKSQILKAPLISTEKERIRKNLNIYEKNIIVGVGQLIHRKGWDLLIDIAADIDAGIYILGDGEEREAIRKAILSKGLTNVHLVGFKSNEETKAFYKAADLFVLPTRYDIWGLVINEAMAYGLPVITTNRCNAGLELVENGVNGYIIEIENRCELKAAIEKAFINKKILSEQSIKRILNYTIEQMVAVHLTTINKGQSMERFLEK